MTRIGTGVLGRGRVRAELRILFLAAWLGIGLVAGDARGSGAATSSVQAGVDQCHDTSVPTRPKRNGTPCDDGDPCTTNDSCTMGACGGAVQPACRLDLQSCAVARRVGPGVSASVTLDDGAGPRTFRLDRPVRACSPAGVSSAVRDSLTHLTCARLRPPAGSSFERRTVQTHDRFGDHTFSIQRPRELCTPAWPAGSSRATQLDAYACHAVQGKSVDQQISFRDERGTASVIVGRPVDLCVPVRIGDAPLRSGQIFLTCYQAKRTGSAAPTSDMTLEGELGRNTLRVGDRKRVCVASTVDSCARFSFTTVPGSPTCGGSGFEWPPSPPLVGALYDAAVGGNKISDLGGSCAYFGGGNSAYFPAAQGATGDTLRFDATSCSGDALPLVASSGGSAASCIEGPSEDVKVCLNDTRLTCNVDGDCPITGPIVGPFGFVGRCAKAPRCFNGAPFPFYSTLANACVVPISSASATGSVKPSTGEITYALAGSNIVYLDRTNFFPATPCPQCIEGACVGGARSGQACTPTASVNQTSTDCLPDDEDFFTFVPGGPATFSTTPKSLSASDGLLCPNQRYPGAFGEPNVRRIELYGSPAGSLLDLQPHEATFLTLGCGGSSGDALVDNLADLPGPGAASLMGVLQMQR